VSPTLQKAYASLIAAQPSSSARLHALCACPVSQSIVTDLVDVHPLVRVMRLADEQGRCADVDEKKTTVERMHVSNDQWKMSWM